MGVGDKMPLPVGQGKRRSQYGTDQQGHLSKAMKFQKQDSMGDF